MIESIVNIFQMICIAITVAISAYNYYRSFRREWMLLALTGGAFFLGDLYYQLFLFFYGHTPRYSSIPDYSWAASLLSLFILVVTLSGEFFSKPRSIFLWLIPLINIPLCVLYILVTGYYVSNIVSVGLMCLILWHTVNALIPGKEKAPAGNDTLKRERPFYILVLAFSAAEYLGWTVSCYWLGDTLWNPYFWFDSMLSFVVLLFPAALKKAVTE